MNKLDIVFMILFAWFLIRGFMRGIISETASILGVAVGFWAAYHWYPGLTEELSSWVTNKESVWVQHPEYVTVASFIILFALVYLAVSTLGWAIKTLAKVTHLGWLDRFMGGVFGFAKAFLFASVIIIAFTVLFPRGKADPVNNSTLAPVITQGTEKIVSLIPRDWRNEFDKNLQSVKTLWEQEQK